MSFLRRLFGRTEEPKRVEDHFVTLLLAALEREDPSIHVEYDPEAFVLRYVDKTEDTPEILLHNSFVIYQQLPESERAEHISNVVAFIIESREPAPTGVDALDRMIPVLRARAAIEAIFVEGKKFSYERSSRVFCGDMLIMLGIDSEASIRLMTDDQLDALDISFDDALALAIGHLDEQGAHSFSQLGDGTYMSCCGDSYDSSRALLPDVIGQLSVKGNPVAIVKDRACLLVTGSEDPEGLELIANVAIEDFENSIRAVSFLPIEWRDGKWQRFAIEAHHPQSLKNLPAFHCSFTYDMSGEVVQQRLGDDWFVANAILCESNGRYGTFATWASDVPTACPLVDAIVIEEKREFPQIIRRLADVLDVCGPFATVDFLPYPQRWLLPGSMTAEQRQTLTTRYAEPDIFGDPHD